jgi:endogenous inhibitor of DNA gyrase (YacG/DUF329 family)
MTPPTRQQCPTCGREIEWSDRFPSRPFCSDRCRLIDLGAWLSEERVIPGNASDTPESVSKSVDESDQA